MFIDGTLASMNECLHARIERLAVQLINKNTYDITSGES
jgi:hypothetical protein